VIVVEGAPDRQDHGRESLVADLFEAVLAVEAEARRADPRNGLDLTAVPNLSDKGLDQIPGGLVEVGWFGET